MINLENRSRLRPAIVSSFLCLIILIAPELAVTVALEYPKLLGEHWLQIFRLYYSKQDRTIVQFRPECAIYDPQLSYTLRPGRCFLKNREHQVEYSANSRGLRDDESSLSGPQIIILGDSQAMGWGVREKEIFASILEERTGKKVLNAAISSYGTARESLMLQRLDTSRMTTLIVQYCDNDIQENFALKKNKGLLPIMSKEAYRKIAEDHTRATQYRLGKHVRGIYQTWKACSPPTTSDEPQEHTEREVRAFLSALSMNAQLLQGVQIIVFEINSYGKNDSEFSVELTRKIQESPADHFYRQLQVLDMSTHLPSGLYFTLDDHITAAGHEVVAQELLSLLSHPNEAP